MSRGARLLLDRRRANSPFGRSPHPLHAPQTPFLPMRNTLTLRNLLLILFLLSAGLLGAAGSALPAQAQSALEWDGGREQMTRAELESLLSRLEEAAASSAYSATLRSEARASAELIRSRLEVGDFQVGDRIFLRVRGEDAMNDTLTVRAGPNLPVPVVGDITLRGVLRSELVEHLESELGRFFRSPVVEAEPLIRISVIGEVANRGFYLVPADLLVTDVLMLAGGPTPAADLDGLRIERGGQRIWEGDSLAQALVQGRTLDQLNLQAGDQIHVPEQVRRSGMDWLTLVATVVTPIVSLGVLLATLF
jgi:protein involved in polysaccharide export with SLBB domain